MPHEVRPSMYRQVWLLKCRALLSPKTAHTNTVLKYPYGNTEQTQSLSTLLLYRVQVPYPLRYKVSMIEYISPLETPKNIMIRAVYTGKKNEKSKQDFENLKELLNVKPAIERFCRKGEI